MHARHRQLTGGDAVKQLAGYDSQLRDVGGDLCVARTGPDEVAAGIGGLDFARAAPNETAGV